MHDFPAFRQAAIRYWERRRIIYNLSLVPPSVLTFVLVAGVARVGDEIPIHRYFTFCLFALSACAANICYTMAYSLEFLFGCDKAESRWLRYGRPAVFAGGLVFALILAAIGGRNIALMEYSHR